MRPVNKNFGSIDRLDIMTMEHKISIPASSDNSFEPRPLPNLPRTDLLYGNREDYISVGVPLYEASITGNWKAAKAILDKQPELVRFAITENHETTLHVATLAKDTKPVKEFVQNLVNMMENKDLELQNKNYNTALSLAAVVGSVKKAEIMVKKNNALPNIPGSQGMLPLYYAALFGERAMVKYLYNNSQKMTGDFWTNENRGWVVLKCVDSNIFDVAIQIMEDYPELTVHKPTILLLLDALSRKPLEFNGTLRNLVVSVGAIIRMAQPIERRIQVLKLLRIIWKNIMKYPTCDIDDILKGPPVVANEDKNRQYPFKIFFVAAKMGNTRFIVELIRAYPDLIWKINDDGHTIFHIAVMGRYEKIFNLLFEIGSMKDLITPLTDKDDNNMLHLVGKTSVEVRSEASGHSLLMMREIRWFLEVEKMMPPSYREKKNKAGETPYEIFFKNNEDVVSKGLKWTKDCMVVAALIVTVAFAAAFTVPGDYDDDKGIPFFSHQRTFIAFVIADAISLFFSTSSVLMFFSILVTPHNSKFDILYQLPAQVWFGLATLSVSVVTIIVTFSISLFVLYHNKLIWIPILISLFAFIPIIFFVSPMLAPLLDMYLSINKDGYIFNPKTRMLYNAN